MSKDTNEELGEMLLREDVVSPSELRKAKAKSDQKGNRLGRELQEMGYIDESDLTNYLSKQHGVPSVNLNEVDIPEDVIQLIPEDVAKRHVAIPVNRSGSTLVVAMADPSNIYGIDDLKFMTDYDIEVVVASESAILEAIDENYSSSSSSGGMMMDLEYDEILEEAEIDPLEDEEEQQRDDIIEVAPPEEAGSEPPIVRMVNLIMRQAIDRGVSDIHIEPYEKDFRVRYRIDGVLQEAMHPPQEMQDALISRIKIMADLDIAEKRLPQDGRIKIRLTEDDREMDFRVSVLPTMFGEKVVMRLLDKSSLQLDMTKLGFEPQALKKFKNAIHQPYGMCLVTGPTGSGKTTTLYSALSELNTPEENISTAEDPIEYNLDGINQTQMNESIGLDFASSLRSFLRQDPDIIMVGEIRDYETAEISIESALTGHMVLSTLHTNDAAGTVSRLINMGVEPFLVTSALNVIVAQRLARRICTNCKEPVNIANETLIDMGVPEDELDNTFYEGKGCPQCDGSGYSGRVALFEVLECNDEFKDYILQGYSTQELKQEAIRMGMNTLRQAGINKMIEGITTAEEVARNTAPDD